MHVPDLAWFYGARRKFLEGPAFLRENAFLCATLGFQAGIVRRGGRALHSKLSGLFFGKCVYFECSARPRFYGFVQAGLPDDLRESSGVLDLTSEGTNRIRSQ